MRRTADGGRTWSAVAAPDAPPAGMYPGSPPQEQLWLTDDSGRRWTPVTVR